MTSCSTRPVRCARTGAPSDRPTCRAGRARNAAARYRAHAPTHHRERRYVQRVCGSAGRRSSVGARSAAADADARRNGARSKKACAQRARVLDALLADLYGPQRLLAEGVIPPELAIRPSEFPLAVSRHRAGRRQPACTSMQPISHAHRTGAGGCSQIARKRRRARAMRSRTARSSSRSCRSRSATSACAAFAASSASCVSSMLSHADAGESPLAVILTPGPFNETYFEHAYLARQLGLAAGRGAGPHRARRHRIYEDTRRPATCPRNSPSSRR